MEPKDLALLVAEVLADKLATDIRILDVDEVTGYTSYFVLATGRSERHVGTLADHVQRALKETPGTRPLGVEGISNGRWALIDYGDAVVHIFLESERELYDLEGLWSDAPRVPFDAETPPLQAP